MSSSSGDLFALEKLVSFFEQQNKSGDYSFFESDDFVKIINYYSENKLNESALSTCRLALKYYPYNIKLLFLRSQLYLNDGEFDYAVETLEKITAIDPSNAEAHYLQAEALYYLEEYDDAFDSLENAEKYLFNKEKILKLRAIIHSANNNIPEALNFYEQYLRYNPKDYSILLDYAICGMLEDSAERVISFAEIVIDENPYNEYAWLKYGELLDYFDKTEEAQHSFEIALALNDKEGRIFYHLGNCFFKKEDYQMAIENFQFAIEKGFLEGNIFIEAGFSCLYLDRKEESEIYFKKAMHLEPENPDVFFGLGMLAFNIKDYTKALRFFRKAIKIDEINTSYWCEMAICLSYMGRPNVAQKAFKKALSIDPYDIDIQLDYLYFLFENQMTTIAISEALNFINVENPDSEMMYFTSGLLFENDFIDEAIILLKKALIDNFSNHHFLFEHFPFLNSNSIINSIIQEFKK